MRSRPTVCKLFRWCSAAAGAGVLWTSSCGMSLRDAALGGTTDFVRAFTFALFNEISPIDVTPPAGGGSDDPFDNPPIQS
jgi:hypothetical protein